MEVVKRDRRINRTRALLGDALISLIEERGYESITVQHVLDKADVGRSTFYSHFHDLDDLFLASQEEIVHSLFHGTEAEIHEGEDAGKRGRLFSTIPLFRRASEKPRLYRSLLVSPGNSVIVARIRRHLDDHLRKRIDALRPGHPQAKLAVAFLSGSLIHLLGYWLDQEKLADPESMDKAFQKLAMPGVRKLLSD